MVKNFDRNRPSSATFGIIYLPMKYLISLMLTLAVTIGFAQKKAIVKKPLTHDVYNGWKDIPVKLITPDGNFGAFLINPQDGDGRAAFIDLRSGKQDSVARASELTVAWDGKFAVFKIRPEQGKVKELRRLKKKKEDLPKDSLGIFSFGAGKVEKVADVRSFKIPQKSGEWLAYLKEAAKKEKVKPDTTKKKSESKKVKENNEDNGFTLVLRNMQNGKEMSFGYIKEYAFQKFGKALMFHSTGNDSTLKAGVYWYDLTEARLTLLNEHHKKHKIKSLVMSEDGLQAAYIADVDTTKALKRLPQVVYWKKGGNATFIHEKTTGVPLNWIVSEHMSPMFSKDSKKLFVGVSPEPLVQDTTLLPEEIVGVEVWNWKDDYIYPQQNRRLDSEKKRAYLSLYDQASNKIVPLASQNIASVEPGDEGNASVALGSDDRKYRREAVWDISSFEDVYVIDLATGAPKLVREGLKGNAQLSPKAQYVYWFSLPDTSWFAYHVQSATTVRLTGDLRVKLADEEDDHPDYPSPYGVAGWTANDESLLVYDRYDIWSVDPSNKRAPVNLTKNGRNDRTVYRYVRLDPEERFVNPEKPLLLRAFNEVTKQGGYYTLSLKDGKLTKLIMSDHRYAQVFKSRETDKILFTRESFTEFPDVWTSTLSFASPKKVTDANPQMKSYLWGSVEMVQWNSLENVPLQGLLYKPEGFDPKKKYPMIVYFYERESDNIHNHVVPAPIRASINYAYYASNGYLIFVPDIVYKVGYPGESAVNCILPGVTNLVQRGFVDEKHIGVQGHSWGGYQSAYLITKTNMFAAAEAGAPVANMISAYGGIRWESGLSRIFQYEKSQSRIGATLWEKPVRYIENSPIFFADKVQTPLLMMHNDGDGAVPWYQGIEYFMALRRLNKPVWMLNYNNQGHGLTQRQDRMDFAIRMSQFFDHYLKGAPLPEWMKRGVPATEKGINNGYATN